jgi:hypothetical protein
MQYVSAAVLSPYRHSFRHFSRRYGYYGVNEDCYTAAQCDATYAGGRHDGYERDSTPG